MLMWWCGVDVVDIIGLEYKIIDIMVSWVVHSLIASLMNFIILRLLKK